MSRTEKVTFEGGNGAVLAASMELPDDRPVAFALFAHCFTCGQNVFAASRITKKLAKQGVAVLRFDFTGLGSSDGDFENTNFTSNIQDLVAAADFLRDNYQAPSLLIGHSLGGAAVLAATQKIPGVRAVVTVGAPYQPSHVEELFTEDLATIEAQGSAEVSIGGRPFRIQRQFVEDLREYTSNHYLEDMRVPLLIFHGPRDEVVGIDNAREIFLAAKHPKSFVSLDEADHLLTKRADAIYVADVLTAWSGRYLEQRAQPMTRESDDQRTVKVAETGDGQFANEVVIGAHKLHADEPKSVGGDDIGPAPYELVMAGLGACTTMTMRMYAQRKGWPMKRAKVELRHKKVVVEEQGSKRSVDHFERDISIEGELSEEQRQRIFEIANRCPVHRTLERSSEIQTVLTD